MSWRIVCTYNGDNEPSFALREVFNFVEDKMKEIGEFPLPWEGSPFVGTEQPLRADGTNLLYQMLEDRHEDMKQAFNKPIIVLRPATLTHYHEER